MKRIIEISITILLIGIVLIFIGIDTISSYPKTMKDFNHIDYSEPIEGTYLQGDISYTLGTYCEESYQINFITTSRARYYLIPFGEKQEKYISIRVPKEEFAKFDELSLDVSEEGYFIGKYQGRVRRCKADVERYLIKNLQYYSFGEDYSELYVPYYIDYTTKGMGVEKIIIGIICIVGGMIGTFLPYYLKRRKSSLNSHYEKIYNDEVRTPETPKRVPINKNIFEDDDL